VTRRVRISRERGYTHLSTKNQVTIPSDVVQEAGFEPGQRFRVELEEDGRVTLTRTRSRAEERRALLRDWKPIFADGDSLAELEAMRDEWDA